MKGQIEYLLDQGIKAVRANQTERARDILTHVIELDQNNEQAWLWLSSVAKTPTDREACLENVLFINPENTYAVVGLNHLRQFPALRTFPPTTLPRLGDSSSLTERGWKPAVAPTSPPPTIRVCPRCQFHNPGWVHLCDRCGADLRQVNVRQAVSKASEARGRSLFTLLEAWGGAITFNRLYAFLPEVDLAAWGRSLAALTMATLFAIIWQPLVLLILRLATGRAQRQTQILTDVVHIAGQALPSILLLALTCLPIALLTWAAARLVGGKQGLKVHFHLTSVAFSAWVVLGALLSSLVAVLSYFSANAALPLLNVMPTLVGTAVNVVGAIWLIQATQTAHNLSLVRAILVAVVTFTLGTLIVFSLGALAGKSFVDTLSQLTTAPFPVLGSLQ